ncbi:unnamed protein product [Durusdinium trenchii]|uniref:Uncharacterized protein n=1 Tax=Durusdinium trenchii TaxID=1381693 RepID=A0ABP0KR71_9DINO
MTFVFCQLGRSCHTRFYLKQACLAKKGHAAARPCRRVPECSATTRRQLLERLEVLEEQQRQEVAELEEQLRALEPAVPTEPVTDAKQRRKDSPEMIAFKQEKRRKTKELKASQLAQRESFWSSLSDLELDVMEEKFGPPWLVSGS